MASIEDFIRFAEARAGLVELPTGCIVVAAEGIGLSEVSLRAIQGKEHEVVFTDGARVGDSYAETFEKLLYRTAHVRFRPRRHSIWAAEQKQDDEPLLEKAREIGEREGFATQWFSDSIAWCGEREDAMAHAFQRRGQGLFMGVYAESSAHVRKAAEAFLEALGLDRSQMFSALRD